MSVLSPAESRVLRPDQYNVRPPYHERFGPLPQRSAYHDDETHYDMPVSIPEFLLRAEDQRLTTTDTYRMQGNGISVDDQVAAYQHYPEVQRSLLAEEKAAQRLMRDHPDVYESLSAAERIARYVKRTRLVAADDQLGLDAVSLKLENEQVLQSFKARGALNAVLEKGADALAGGVATRSQGNHAQGVALAAQQLGVSATIFMSHTASSLKVGATESLGATVIRSGKDFAATEAALQDFLSDNPEVTEVHPYDDATVRQGQGTVGVELFDQDPSIRTLYVPLGGGGLLGGCGAVAKAYDAGIEVVGVQLARPGAPTRMSGAQAFVFRDHTPNPLSDGTAVRRPGEYIQHGFGTVVDRIMTVDEYDLAQTVVELEQEMQIVAEAAGALAVTAARVDIERRPGRACAIVSGGNRSAAATKQLYAMAHKSMLKTA